MAGFIRIRRSQAATPGQVAMILASISCRIDKLEALTRPSPKPTGSPAR